MRVECSEGLRSRFRSGEKLARHTTFRIGGPAEVFFEPEDLQELAEALECLQREGRRVYILGGGSNLLVRDEGVKGAVISLRKGGGFRQVEIEGERVKAGAGAMLPKVVQQCASSGLSGLEGLVGIPGTMGGAARMNAGGKHGNIGPTMQSATVLRRDGGTERLPHDKLAFGYRRSNLSDFIVLEMELALKKDSIEAVKDKTHAIYEEKKSSQPLSDWSAGCVFKNPPGGSAGALIDKAGLKGTRVGGAAVSHKHANFIVNEGGGTASDVLRLIDIVRERVQKEFGVALQLEVEIW